jgi:3'-5' exoribonuclease
MSAIVLLAASVAQTVRRSPCQVRAVADDSLVMSAIDINREAALRDLPDGSTVDRVLLVRDVQHCTTRTGSEYLRLVVGDRSAHLPGVMWEPSAEADSGPVLRVVGRVTQHPRYGRQVIVSELRASDPDEADLRLLLPGPAEPLGDLARRLDGTIESVEDAWLRTLLGGLIGPAGELRERFVSATAAKYNHHAYPGGLLEHTLQVTAATAVVGALYRGVDRDLAVAGALLHDIGKLDAYDDDPVARDMTDAGRLEGEIPMGYYRVRRAIEQIPGFPSERARALLHVILSHHGLLEHGSPVAPCTREATIVHAMDELSGRFGAFDRLERETAADEAWSRYDRVLDTSAWLASPGLDGQKRGAAASEVGS